MRITFDPFNQPPATPISRRRATALLVLLFVALALIALDMQGVLDPAKNAAQAVLQPVAQTLTQTRLRIADTIGSVTGQNPSQQEIVRLQDEVRQLREENIRLQTYKDQIGQLQQQLQIDQTYNWQTLAATVVRGSTDSGRRIIRINRGSVDQIEVGMAVISQEGGSPAALIGVVDQVYAQAADVLLITDYGSKISANTAGADQIAEGLIAGQWQLGSRIKLTNVERDVPLQVGQYIVTSGLSQAKATNTPVAEIPRNVPIGTILSTEANGHSQTAEVQPFVDPDRVRDVWVITGER